MKLREFSNLDQLRQAEITWEEGILEKHWTDHECYFMLYKLNDFFVEMAFHIGTDNLIRVRSFG